MERTWEINGNLSEEGYGLVNYGTFQLGIICVIELFLKTFGVNQMKQIDLYIDNATDNSGYTPIITPVLKKYLIIKLGISKESDLATIVYQFAHELTHYIFYTYYGFNKPRATELEETVCTATSLIAIKNICPDDFDRYCQHVSILANESYRNGLNLALEINFDLGLIKKKIENFKYN